MIDDPVGEADTEVGRYRKVEEVTPDYLLRYLRYLCYIRLGNSSNISKT